MRSTEISSQNMSLHRFDRRTNVFRELALNIFSYFYEFTLGICALHSKCMSCNVVNREMSSIRDTCCQKQRSDVREWKGDKQKLCITIPQKILSELSHAVFGLGQSYTHYRYCFTLSSVTNANSFMYVLGLNFGIGLRLSVFSQSL